MERFFLNAQVLRILKSLHSSKVWSRILSLGIIRFSAKDVEKRSSDGCLLSRTFGLRCNDLEGRDPEIGRVVSDALTALPVVGDGAARRVRRARWPRSRCCADSLRCIAKSAEPNSSARSATTIQTNCKRYERDQRISPLRSSLSTTPPSE